MNGLSVLNCAAGDIEINFDKNDRRDVERAKKMITDMLKRGYRIVVKDGDDWKIVKRFSAKRECYVIQEVVDDDKDKEPKPKTATRPRKAKKATRTKNVPLRKTRAYGVAPTAGG